MSKSTAEGEASPLEGQLEGRDRAHQRLDERVHQSQRREGRWAKESKQGLRAPPQNVSKKMTFSSDSSMVVKMEYS